MQSAQCLIPNPAFDVPGGRIEKKDLVDAKIHPHAIGNTYYEIRDTKPQILAPNRYILALDCWSTDRLIVAFRSFWPVTSAFYQINPTKNPIQLQE